MKKSYEIKGRNSLVIDDRHQGERYKTITFSVRGELLAAPLSKPKVKELIADLQEWLEEEK